MGVGERWLVQVEPLWIAIVRGFGTCKTEIAVAVGVEVVVAVVVVVVVEGAGGCEGVA